MNDEVVHLLSKLVQLAYYEGIEAGYDEAQRGVVEALQEALQGVVGEPRPKSELWDVSEARAKLTFLVRDER